jgi:hypothetical protein
VSSVKKKMEKEDGFWVMGTGVKLKARELMARRLGGWKAGMLGSSKLKAERSKEESS